MKTLECSHATGAHDEPCDLVAGLEAELKRMHEEMAWLRMDLDYKIQEHECLLSIQKDRELRGQLVFASKVPAFRKRQEEDYKRHLQNIADADELCALRKQVAELKLSLSQKFCPHCGKKVNDV